MEIQVWIFITLERPIIASVLRLLAIGGLAMVITAEMTNISGHTFKWGSTPSDGHK
jgi:hypothetical protein